MSTPASVGGHPIHPMLVGLPIGLWIFSFVSDVVFLAGWAGPTWKIVASYTIAAGVIGALLAAVPGFIDFLSITDRRVGRIALNHMVLNLFTVVLFALSFGLRVVYPLGALPVVVSAAGLVSLAIAGWLGGELVFVHQMGVNKRPRSR
ncbi:MAG TPA: DUF2231 domain-containing protein [Methylomirabilota bacterium]|nr:DUF2231 domain-containing protein [Methylomirabilota bacterium]